MRVMGSRFRRNDGSCLSQSFTTLRVCLELLRARRSVLDLPGLAQGIRGFIDAQKNCRFE